MLIYIYIYWLIISLAFSLNAYGQDSTHISYTISGGVNTSQYEDGSNGPLLVSSPLLPIHYKLGGDFSILADIPIYKSLFLRTGISYVYSISEFYIPLNGGYVGFLPFYYTNLLSVNNICIPVLIKISSKKPRNNMYVAAGFDIIYNINSPLTTLGFNNSSQNEFIFSNKKTNSLGFDYTIVIGKYFTICKNEFFAEIQYNQDITNWNYELTPLFNYPYSNPTLPLKNYSGSINIGWVFK